MTGDDPVANDDLVPCDGCGKLVDEGELFAKSHRLTDIIWLCEPCRWG